MAVQQRRNSSTRRDKRRTHYKLVVTSATRRPMHRQLKKQRHKAFSKEEGPFPYEGDGLFLCLQKILSKSSYFLVFHQ